jgi:cellobiose phosphorylase
MLGHAQDPAEMRRLVEHHLKPGAAAAELEAVRAWLRERTSRVRVATPSPDLDLMLGSWGSYQVLQSARTSALASGEHLASPAEFLAAADAAEALLPLDPALSRELLLTLLQHQFKSGCVLHPGADTRELTVPAELGCLDTALRLPLLVCSYVKETGDAALLKERVAFLDDGSATVHQHATAAADFARKHAGSAGLPFHPGSEVLTGLDGGGEDSPDGSVKLAMMLAAAYSELGELALFLGERARARKLKERFEELAATIDRTAWSGRWYRRMVSAQGRWLGGEERGGPLFLDVQAWALLSGVAHGARARRMLEAIRQLNDSRFGPCLLSEPFRGWVPSIGSVTSMTPGFGPNGSIRGVETLQIAAGALMLGESELALGWLERLSPLTCGRPAEEYRAEPFLWPGWIAGPAAGPTAGEAHGAWESPAAAWALKTAFSWMFGLRPGYAGLAIEPCLPPAWENCTIVRPFRGAVYRIEYRNPGRHSRGLAALTVDGKRLQGNVVPPHSDGREHRVEVVLS